MRKSRGKVYYPQVHGPVVLIYLSTGLRVPAASLAIIPTSPRRPTSKERSTDMAWLPPPMTGYVVSAAIFGTYLLVCLVVAAVYTVVIVSQRRSFWVAARLVGRALWPF